MTFRSMAISLAIVVVFFGGSVLVTRNAASATVSIAPPAVDDALAAQSGQATAVLAGGCFWGVQLVFEHVKGVISATDGYSGGSADTAQYETVSAGGTGHAETVKVVYDPSQITYGRLLQVFFSVATDPTEFNRQGPDEGTQYRSVIFYSNEDQQRIAQAYIAQIDQAHVFRKPIVTQVVPLQAFYQAEAYHQDYATHHPDSMYILTYDAPKLDKLKKSLPDLYVKKR
ncbi:MAG: peptide-methionine (S)-S-oxide reductase MsrA [Candidatus Acidiferrales bacterium]|jgi:peptide-methionine (S)-S-oxide reductase